MVTARLQIYEEQNSNKDSAAVGVREHTCGFSSFSMAEVAVMARANTANSLVFMYGSSWIVTAMLFVTSILPLGSVDSRFRSEYKIGRPVFFFVLADQAMGKPNDSKIRAVEKYLIDLGLTANPDLLNKRDTEPPGWGIQGVIRGGKGKVSDGTSSFRKMLGI